VLAIALGAAVVLVPVRPAAAHSPHDQIPGVAVSADFGPGTGLAFAISRARLLRSTDGGETWSEVTRGITTAAGPSSVVLTPADPDRAMISTRGGGAFTSRDRGDTWEAVGPGVPDDLAWAALSPTDADLAFASGAFGTGLFRSDDGGASWTDTGIAGATAIAFGPDDAGTVVVGDLQGQVHRSTDAGASWTDGADATEGDKAVRALLVGPGADLATATVWAGTDGDGLQRSTDGGATFEPGPDLGDPRVRSLVAPTTSREGFGTIWASTWAGGVCQSDDAGETFTCGDEGLTTDDQADELPTNLPQFGHLAIGGDGQTALLGGYDGLFRSTDAGGAWTEIETQRPDAVVAISLAASSDGPPTVVLTRYLNGLLVSTDDAESWTPRNDGVANETDWSRREDYINRLVAVTASPAFEDDQTLFASIRGYIARSTDGGESWRTLVPEGIANELEQPPDYFFLALSPGYADDGVVLLGTNRGKLFRSDDRGDSFEQVDGPGVEILAMAMSPAFEQDQTALAATVDGLVRTTDGGRTWTDAPAPDGLVTGLAFAPTFADDGRVWAGTADGLATTTDLDDGWELARADGLPPDAAVDAVVPAPTAEDPVVLVSLRGRGLHRSTDGGASFAPVAADLLADQHQVANWYHPTTAPIAFSPDFAGDQTVWAFSGATLLRSDDAGETWREVEHPVVTHSTDPEDAPGPLLRTPTPGMVGVINDAAPGSGRDEGGPSAALVGVAAGAALVVVLGWLLARRVRRP
jgi:photosystem II stability/assembly factor-like uncharacterized protein